MCLCEWMNVSMDTLFFSFFLLLFDDPVCWVMWMCIKCESFSVWTFHVQSSQCFMCVFRSLAFSPSLSRAHNHTQAHTLTHIHNAISQSLLLYATLMFTQRISTVVYVFFIRPLLRCIHVLYTCASTSAFVCFRNERKNSNINNSTTKQWNATVKT